jgi:hypothetical protein
MKSVIWCEIILLLAFEVKLVNQYPDLLVDYPVAVAEPVGLMSGLANSVMYSGLVCAIG